PDGDEEPPILKALIDAARSGERLPAKAQASLEKLFERVRDPHHKKRSMPLEVMIGPFEIACVRDKYVVSPAGTIYWRRVLRDFASSSAEATKTVIGFDRDHAPAHNHRYPHYAAGAVAPRGWPCRGFLPTIPAAFPGRSKT